MLYSNPAWPNVSSYATAQPAVRATDQYVPPTALTRSSMLTSNPVSVPSWPSVHSYATAHPAARATNKLSSYRQRLDSIPMDAICRVSSESRAVSVENNDASKVTSSQPLTMKRRREVSNSQIDSDDGDNDGLDDGSKNEVCFSNWQDRHWGKRLDELRRYRDCTGTFAVPQTDTPLSRWVGRQHYQYRLMRDGKPSLMTEERAKALEEIGIQSWRGRRTRCHME
jgi:hypothetical protein